LQEAVAGHRNAIDCMERLLAKDPNNANYQRELMFKYSHLGDVLGNPNLSNLGDMPGAIAAYRKMSEVARRLYDADPADQRAIGDYGISLARTGAVLPAADGKGRVEAFSRSIELMQQVSRKDPNNLAIQVEISAVHTFLGDAYRSMNRIDAAMQVYREGLAIAEPLLSSGSTTVATAYVALCRSLGELHAGRGNRERALEYTRKVLALEDPGNAAAAKWSANLRNAIRPRIHGAVALTYVAAGERVEAKKWLQKSINSYRELQRKSPPNEGRLREMRNLERMLETLQ
jgi:tetratricopeptide (TPR) repeat protein